MSLTTFDDASISQTQDEDTGLSVDSFIKPAPVIQSDDSWDQATPSSWTGLLPKVPTGKIPNFGIDIKAPSLDSTPGTTRDLFPVQPQVDNTDLGPKTGYNPLNPMSWLDHLVAGWGRALVPGLKDLGDSLGSVGSGIEQSEFGRAVGTPLKGGLDIVGGIASDMIDHTIKGAGILGGDLFGNVGAAKDALGRGNFSDFAMNAPILGLGTKTISRAYNAMFKDDAQARQQLLDEAEFLGTILPAGWAVKTGRAAGAAAFLHSAQEGAAGRALGLLDTISRGIGLPEVGAGETAQSFLRAGAGAASHLAKDIMSVAFGAEVGGIVSEQFIPESSEINHIIQQQQILDEKSPWRAPLELGTAMLVDPFPWLGAAVNNSVTREALHGILRGPTTLERVFPEMAGKIEEDFSHIVDSHLIDRLAYQRLERDLVDVNGIARDITPEMHRAKVNELTDILSGNAGTIAHSNGLRQEMARELYREMADTITHRPEFSEKAFKFEDFKQSFNEMLQGHRIVGEYEPMAGRGGHMLVRDSVYTTRDADQALDAFAKPGKQNTKGINFSVARNREIPVGEWEDLVRDHPILKEIDNRTPNGVLSELKELRDSLPTEPSKGLMGKAADLVRDRGWFKVIEGPNARAALKPDQVIPSGHPAAREIRKVYRDIGEPSKGRQLTLQDAARVMLDNGKDAEAARLEKYLREQTAMMTENRRGDVSFTRPFLRPNYELAKKMPDLPNRLGNLVAGFREIIPNTELYQDFRRRLENTFLEKGATREETRAFYDALTKKADEMLAPGATAVEARSPLHAGQMIQKVWDESVGRLAGKVNAAQLLSEAAPRETWKDFLGVITGQRIGKVGVGPSVFAHLRSRGGPLGDFWRWWAYVGHPMLRYETSLLYQAQVPVESVLLNVINGASYLPISKVMAKAVDEYAKEVINVAGKNLGERYSLVGSETSQLERTGFSRSESLNDRIKFIKRQVAAEFPERFAKSFESLYPKDYKILRANYNTDREFAEAMLLNKQAIQEFLSKSVPKEDLLAAGHIGTPEEVAAKASQADPTKKVEQLLTEHEPKIDGSAVVDQLKLDIETDARLARKVWAKINGARRLGDARVREVIANLSDESLLSVASRKADFLNTNEDVLNEIKKRGLKRSNGPNPNLAPPKGGGPTTIPEAPVVVEAAEPQLDPVIRDAYLRTAEAIRQAMRESYASAVTTHISNPTRRYWERSVSHPALIYPLSWTLKAAGEWTKFLAHSAFGLKTGLGGAVAWDDVKSATTNTLMNDPDVWKWINRHPETIHVLSYIMPGSPEGLGFGLMSLPMKDAINLSRNFWTGRPLDQGLQNPVRIGLIRDFVDVGNRPSVLHSLWSEWTQGKPLTKLNRQGL